MKHLNGRKHRILFKAGVILLVVNVPIGYGGVAIGALVSAITRDPRGIMVGAGIYALSWVVLAVGILLLGPGGYRYAKDFWRARFKKHKDTSDDATG